MKEEEIKEKFLTKHFSFLRLYFRKRKEIREEERLSKRRRGATSLELRLVLELASSSSLLLLEALE